MAHTKSRKFSLTLFSMCLITVVLYLATGSKVVEALYTPFIGGILGALGLYLTGNVTQKHLVAKQEKTEEEPEA